MSTSEVEYQAVRNLAKADRRYRAVVYVLTLIFFGMLTFLAFGVYAGQVRQQEQTQFLLTKISDITKQRLHETKVQNEQTRRYITCLFVLPIADRTLAAQNRCTAASKEVGAT